MILKSPHPYRLSSVTESVALPPEARWHAMTNPNSTAAIPLIAIESRECLKCQGPMVLARIMPGGLNFDLRTFECAKCDHVEKIMITTDPMMTDTLGWLLGELRPPT